MKFKRKNTNRIAGTIIKKTISKKLDSLIYLTTFRCNNSCHFCCFKDSINKKFDELSLEEVKKIVDKLPHIKDYSISGGEPFLRKELPELCELFNKLNPDELCLPTNGVMTDLIIKTTRKVLQKVNHRVMIAISIDGLKETHNKERGNFDKVVKTCHELAKLREEYGTDKLNFKITTVVTKNNINELKELADWVYYNLKPCYHSFELVREEMCKISPLLPSPQELEKIRTLFVDNSKRYDYSHKGLRAKLSTALKSTLFDYYLDMIENKRGLKCYAGKLTAVLYPDGKVSACELLPPLGNVRDYNYDLQKLLKKTKIPKNCWCTHTCFQIMNIKYSYKGWLKWLNKLLHMK